MNLAIIAALSLILVLVWSNKLQGGIQEMQALCTGTDVIAISPDGKLLAASAGPLKDRQIGAISYTANGTIKLYTFPNGEVVRTLEAFYVTKIAFAFDNSLIAAGNKAGEIKIWRVSDGQLLQSVSASVILPGHENVHLLTFSRDGQTLVTGVAGRTDVWRVADGKLRYSIPHAKFICRGDLSPDGQILALATPGTNAITFFRLSDGTVLREVKIYGIPKFSPDGQLLAIYHVNYKPRKEISLYRLKDNTLFGTLEVGNLEVGVEEFAFSPDGRYVAATYRTGGVRGGVLIIPDSVSPHRWHLSLWRVDDKPSKTVYPKTIQSKDKTFMALAFSPDSKTLVSGGDKIRLWRLP